MRIHYLRKVAVCALTLFCALVTIQATHDLFHPHETEKCEIVIALETSVLPASQALFTVSLFAVDTVAQPHRRDVVQVIYSTQYSRGPPA